MSEHDFTDGLEDDDDLGQTPAFFVVHLTEAEPPSEADVAAQLMGLVPGTTRVSLNDAPPAEDFDGIWHFAVLPPDFPLPMIVRLAPAPPAEAFNDLPIALGKIHYVLFIEAWLDPDDPVTSYVRIMHLLSKLAPTSPAILDVDSGTWYPPLERSQLFLELPEDAVPAEVLFTVRAVESEDGEEGWLMTAGLTRCGLPEMEMHQVPPEYLEVGSAVLVSLGLMRLGTEAPQPAERELIDDGYAVSYWMLDDALDLLPVDTLGGRESRGDMGHAWRLAVGEENVWPPAPPLRVLEAIAGGRAGFLIPDEVIDRRKRAAQARWPEVADAFAAQSRALKNGDDSAEFYVKVAMSDDSAESTHGWGRVVGIEGGSVDIVQALESEAEGEGPSRRIKAGNILDWRVVTLAGEYFEAPMTTGLAEAMAVGRARE